MGIIGTRSLDTPIPGIKEIVAENSNALESGRHAVVALEALRKNRKDTKHKLFSERIRKIWVSAFC